MSMTFEAQSAAFREDIAGIDTPRDASMLADIRMPVAANSAPEAGWATRNPERAMALLFVNPRDGALADELVAA
jgi:hypothetical protein